MSTRVRTNSAGISRRAKPKDHVRSLTDLGIFQQLAVSKLATVTGAKGLALEGQGVAVIDKRNKGGVTA